MARTAENGQEPAEVRSQVADRTGMAAKRLFSDLKEAVQPARSLQGRRRADDGQNRQDDVDRGLARGNPEAKDQHDEADTADEAQAHTALAGTVEQCRQNDDQLNPKVKSESHVFSRMWIEDARIVLPYHPKRGSYSAGV